MKRTILLLLSVALTTVISAYTLKHVSVHDPSIVWDPVNKRYHIFGSHRAHAVSADLMSWTATNIPWQTATSNNAANKDAFTTPQVTKVKKGGVEYTLNFDAIAWSARGGAGYSVDGNMWAPDVIWNKKMQKWCMYLSINGNNWYSSIILLTADKITGPYRYQAPVVISGFYSGNAYKDTDLEIVLGTQNSLPARYSAPWAATNKPSFPNSIDPCVFYDEEGKLWMSYGSWSGGIFMLELDEETGLRDYDVKYDSNNTSDAYFGKKIAGGYYVSGEGSYIEYIGGYYYLFMSYGGLAAGGDPDDYNKGGYQMRVFRSKNPDGPYVGPNSKTALYTYFTMNFGKNDTENRGENIFGCYTDWGNLAKGNNGERSQGHNSIIAAEDGRTYLVYHTRFQNAGEGHQVRVHQVFQNEKGWLVAAPFEYTGEKVTSADIASTQQVSTSRFPGTYKLLVHKYGLDHTKKETVSPVEIKLNHDGTISGAYTGTWKATQGTSYVTIKLGSTNYFGVMVGQTLETSTTTTIAFTGMAPTGVTAWAYQTEADLSGIDDTVISNKLTSIVYDLKGRRISPSDMKQGVYIVNGRKIIVK